MLLLAVALPSVALLGPTLTPTPAAAQTASTVQTVPRIPGVRIAVQGEIASTDQQGVAQFSGAVDLSSDTIDVLDTRVRLSPARRARFSKIRRTAEGYAAAFDTDVRVTVDAATVGGAPIDPARASRIELRSPLTGERQSARPGEQVWLHSKRVIAELGTVRPREVPWSVQRLAIDGKQVVSRGQQRFIPADLPRDDRVVVVQARLFAADITAYDTLLGSSTGTAVLLTHPDGSTSRHPLGPDGAVRIPDLVPGAYEVTVAGSGPLIARPVTISRDQQIELDVYTWWDVVILAFIVLLFFAGLAIVGRQRPARPGTPARTIARPTRARAPETDSATDDQPATDDQTLDRR